LRIEVGKPDEAVFFAEWFGQPAETASKILRVPAAMQPGGGKSVAGLSKADGGDENLVPTGISSSTS